jgi:hypothetical protein
MIRAEKYVQTGYEVSYSIDVESDAEFLSHEVEFLVNAPTKGEALMKVENYMNETPFTFSDGLVWNVESFNDVVIRVPYAIPNFVVTMNNMVEHDIPVAVTYLKDGSTNAVLVDLRELDKED